MKIIAVVAKEDKIREDNHAYSPVAFRCNNLLIQEKRRLYRTTGTVNIDYKQE